MLDLRNHASDIWIPQPFELGEALAKTTHLAVMAACIKPLRQTTDPHIPNRIIGCEMWRGLDWLADSN